MPQLTVDVAVVGGGPAGSHTARELKEQDPSLNIALFERGEKPAGNCAGGLGLPFLKYVGMEPPEEVIEQHIRGLALKSRDEEFIINLHDMDNKYIDWLGEETNKLGWILDRQEWDDYQLLQASKAGANVYRKHTVKSVSQNGNSVELEVMNRQDNEKLQVKANYVALANGPTWDLAIEAGFNENDVIPANEHLHMGLQYHMKDPEFFEKYGNDTILLYLDREYAPGGYTWSFPESDRYTRWGNGIPLEKNTTADECLDKFFEDHGKKDLTETSREKTNALIPTARPLNSCVNGRVALVGDTGHHCDPVHGGGMLIGARAGVQLAHAITEGDINSYDSKWKDDVLDTLHHRFIVRDAMVKMNNNQYNRLIRAFKGFKFKDMDGDKEIPRLMWHALQNDKQIFSKAAINATRSVIKNKVGV